MAKKTVKAPPIEQSVTDITTEATKIKTTPETPAYSAHAIHMMRTAQVNTLTLSQMADQKASILMGATFLVFSLSISRTLGGNVPFALMVLAIVSFISSLCAVMAVLPSFKKAKSPGTVSNKLFFCHFANLDQDEWMEDMLAAMRSDEAVFRTMMQDIYQNGQVLANRKYKFLSLAYRIFVIGLFVTLVTFAIETSLA